MDQTEFAALRREYASRQLTRESVAADPFEQFEIWMSEAMRSKIVDATAMTVSTVGPEGCPSSRIVLLKGYGSGGFVFYTNYESKKGRDLAADPNVALHLYWADLERQVEIRGTAQKTSREESETYFASRPRESQIGAWASHQSRPLSDRFELEDKVAELRQRFEGTEVPCPPNWGGFRVTPFAIEFWQGRVSRLHDRICYELKGDNWTISRLAP